MTDIHCYNCGGFIGDPSKVSHRLPGSVLHKSFGATPISALCTCTPPVVYGPPAGRSSSTGQARLN
jgi:hypothetical protein